MNPVEVLDAVVALGYKSEVVEVVGQQIITLDSVSVSDLSSCGLSGRDVVAIRQHLVSSVRCVRLSNYLVLSEFAVDRAYGRLVDISHAYLESLIPPFAWKGRKRQGVGAGVPRLESFSIRAAFSSVLHVVL